MKRLLTCLLAVMLLLALTPCSSSSPGPGAITSAYAAVVRPHTAASVQNKVQNLFIFIPIIPLF